MTATARKTPWVNEDRVLAHAMPLLFQKGWPVIAELVQNAQRAGSRQVGITRRGEEGTLGVEDDGEGIADLQELIPLFVVGESDYANPDVAQQRPAGMGFYALLSSAQEVTLTSQFGTLTVESEKWCNDPAYRDTMPNRMDPTVTCRQGVRMTATGLNETVRTLSDAIIQGRLAGYTQLQILYNGTPIEPYDPSQHYQYRVSVDGVEVWWGPRKGGHCSSPVPPGDPDGYSAYAWVNWFGQLIPARIHTTYPMYLVVRKGYPFNPKLPDREAILNDEAWTAFKQKVQTAICRFICDRPVEYLSNQYDLVEMAHDMDPAYFKAHSPVGTFWHITHAEEEAEEPRYQYQTLVLSVDQPVRVIGNDVDDISGKIRAMDGSPVLFECFCGYHNTHLIGLLAEQGHEFRVQRHVPDAMPVAIACEAWIELEKLDDRYEKLGITWARKGILVIHYEDGVESRYDLEGQVIMDEDYQWVWDLSVIVIGEDLVAVLEDNQSWLFFYYADWDTDSYETQRERFEEEFDHLIDQMTDKVPLLAALRTAGIGDPAEIVSIVLESTEKGHRTATVTYGNGVPKKTFKVR